jgi:hypothetical protein
VVVPRPVLAAPVLAWVAAEPGLVLVAEVEALASVPAPLVSVVSRSASALASWSALATAAVSDSA